MTAMQAALAVMRGLLLAASLQLFGALVVVTLVGRFSLWRVLRPAFWALLGVGPVWFALQAVAIAEPRGPAESVGVIWLVLTQTVVGHGFAGRTLCWLACLVIARRWPGLAIIPAGIAVALQGAAGHAAATGEWLLQAAIMAHLLAAGAWLGGLWPLRLALRDVDPARVAGRFSWLGMVCVVTLAVTAAIQANALAGGLPGFLGTGFGRVLLAKIGLFACLLALAARNCFVLAPHLDTSLRALERSLLVELGLGVSIVAAAALLTTLPPGAHEQPDWPFKWRPSLAALADDDLRAEIGRALLALTGAAALVAAATWHRRLRLPAPACAIVLVWLAAPSLGLLLVPAVPTQYWRSQSGGDAGALDRGRLAFQAHCVSCHGASGQGDGPRANSLPVPPADLTAPHLWDHSDGELFWWISEGMTAPDGQTVMPGVKSDLTAQERWEVIDFIHSTNTAGALLPPAAHRH